MNKKSAIIVANWKMNLTLSEMRQFFSDFQLPAQCSNKIYIAPSTPFIALAKNYTDKQNIGIGAQNCSSEKQGAFTGETSAEQLQSINTKFVILGHSERRQLFAEKEDVLAKKIEQVLNTSMQVIYCVGETLAQREGNQLESTLINQLQALSPFKQKNAWKSLILAYEPVWAIGTGKVATVEQVQEVHHFLQTTFQRLFPGAELPPILYGGSVNAQNAQSLYILPSVAGFLVGGASLKPKDFSLICSVQ